MRLPTARTAEYLCVIFILLGFLNVLLTKYSELWIDAAVFTALMAVAGWFATVKENNLLLIIITFILLLPNVLIMGAIEGVRGILNIARKDITTTKQIKK